MSEKIIEEQIKENIKDTKEEKQPERKNQDYQKPFNRFNKFEKRKNYYGDNQEEMFSSVLSRRKVSKTRAGGRRQGFSVLVAIGNKKGTIGIGSARSVYFNDAIQKAEQRAKKNLIKIPLLNGRTVPHNVTGSMCSTSVLVHKAKLGTGIVAGGCLWHVFDLLGVKDVVCKCIGASNSNHNMVYSLMEALKTIEILPNIAARRNKTVKELLNQRAQFSNNKQETTIEKIG